MATMTRFIATLLAYHIPRTGTGQQRRRLLTGGKLSPAGLHSGACRAHNRAGVDPQLNTDPRRDIEQIAEFVNSTVLARPPAASAGAGAPAAARRGSLPPIKGRSGFNNWLYARWRNRGNAFYTFLGSLLAMMLSGGVAWATNKPLLFPSLGATCFLMFETPMAEVSSTRNAVIGHYIGGAIGFFWLFVFGLIDKPDALAAGWSVGRWAAVALSLSFTGGILRLLRAAHPPAGATTVIVSLGLLNTGIDMLWLALGVLLIVIPAGMFNRICGVPAPLWAKPWPGLRALLGRSGRSGKAEPEPEVTPFAGGLLDQWRSAEPVQDETPSRR
jgi:CBS domain-containing membrane protein